MQATDVSAVVQDYWIRCLPHDFPLLTATPHDGYDAHFASLIELLDPSLVDGRGGLVGTAYRRHVVRRLKQHIRDPATGAPLPRHAMLAVEHGIVTHRASLQWARSAMTALAEPSLAQPRAQGAQLLS